MNVLASGLSFLGVGATPPAPDWGGMTSDGRSVLLEGDAYVATIPGLVILVVALAFNLIGDGVRDALDPHKQTSCPAPEHAPRALRPHRAGVPGRQRKERRRWTHHCCGWRGCRPTSPPSTG